MSDSYLKDIKGVKGSKGKEFEVAKDSISSQVQLFCFTYAGGSASFYDQIERDLNPLEVIKLEYSGHGSRRKEPLYNDFDELSVDMLECISDCYRGEGYAMFGYSMGCIAIVEVLKKMIAVGYKLPNAVFLAAHEPHEKSELQGFVNDGTEEEIDKWVKNRTVSFGAVPEKLLNNEPFWRLYLPLYRSDYEMIAKYHFNDMNLKTNIPATFFYSESDTPLVEMKKWSECFTKDIDFYEFEGNHFFMSEHHKEMADIINMKLLENSGREVSENGE